MILVVDMGNTRIKWRVAEGEIHLAQGYIASDAQLSTLNEKIFPFRDAIAQVLVASVLSLDMEERFSSWCQDFLGKGAQFVRSQPYACGVYNAYEDSTLLGVDRWLALISGFNRVGKACVVVSCGTAVTVDLIAGNGRHLGGYIAPGFNLMLGALNRNTHLVKVNFDASLLTLNPGRNTQAATHSAAAAMLIGLINSARSHLRNFERVDDIDVLVSGGDGEKITPLLGDATFIPDLVLDGLISIARQN